MDLTAIVCDRARERGADLVGIAPVERFRGAPLRMSPQGLLPGARSVVVAAIHHLDAAVELGGEPTPHDMGPYGSQSRVMNPMLDDISFWLARLLEERGCQALPIASSNIWRYHGYKDLKVDFAPDLAHRYAAVAAGLGEIGWSGLALTPQFGPRQRFVSVITDAELVPSPMYEGDPLCDRCLACVENCPTDAFRKEVAKINEIEIGGRAFQFPDTNKWRCGWAENFCLDLAHVIPERVNEEVILEYLEKYGPRGGEEGCCLKFCMVPERRYSMPAYTRAPRRKKEVSEATASGRLTEIERIFQASGLEVMSVAPVEALAEGSGVHPECHLPDVRSAVSLGLAPPRGSEGNGEVADVLRRRLDYAAFQVAHHLDIEGHAAVTGTKIADQVVAQRLRIYRPGMSFTTVLTGADLPRATTHRPKAEAALTPEALRRHCREAGADLVGFFTSERFDRFRAAFEPAGLLPEVTEIVRDRSFAGYGPYLPDVEPHTVGLKGPEDWLRAARSVIVIGLHFPDSALDTAKVTPAETVGPYAFVQYETLNLLGDIAFRVVARLNDAGYRACFTADLTGLASRVKNSRGLLPDMRANLFPAILAGLAYPGLHGHPITGEYGVRQRFLAIVSDLPLPDDPLYGGEIACATCKRPCVQACPTGAITGEEHPLFIEGREFPLRRIDCFACDWAKLYCLAGSEGAAYCGVGAHAPLPERRNAEEIVNALGRVHWGVQKRHLNIAEECLRVCPPRGSAERAGR